MPVLLLIVGINFIGVGALIPVLPYTVIEMLGLPASVMTMLLASFALAMFVANPILGRLSDHYGRRRILFLSLAISAASIKVTASITPRPETSVASIFGKITNATLSQAARVPCGPYFENSLT